MFFLHSATGGKAHVMTKPLEILLVEDNEGDVDMVQEALQDEIPTCNVSVANNGREALDCLFKQGNFRDVATPQLILLDLNMPRIDGKILLKIVKQDERLKSIPVVVLTSSKAPSDIQEAYELRANCYIVKPFDGKEFRSSIKQAVNFWRNVAQLPHEATTSLI